MLLEVVEKFGELVFFLNCILQNIRNTSQGSLQLVFLVYDVFKLVVGVTHTYFVLNFKLNLIKLFKI